MAQTPHFALHNQTDKERKYDRQLRLWAASGQAALESADILLINSGPGTVGIETLKNLVLPGIGRFTIADEALVDCADLGVNFFLDQSCLGQPRAQCCAELLVELNPEVVCDWFPKATGSLDFQELLGPNHFNMIIYTLPLEPEKLRVIEEYGRQHLTPLVAIHCVGFYSYFRVTLPGIFPIVDTHPDVTITADLRLLSPWPELSRFAMDMTNAIDSLNSQDHGHLPMVVILLHYLSVWKQEHSGSHPTSYTEKIRFRTMISEAMRRDNPEGGEENFEEAIAAVMKHVTRPTIPSSLRHVFDYQHEDEGQLNSSFWTIAEAVKQFYHEHQQLPVAGVLPDMKAQSNVYHELQNIYKDKARQDASDVLTRVHNRTGRGSVDLADVELFCTNARFIKLINTTGEGPSRIKQVVARDLRNDEEAGITGAETPMSLISIYLVLAATSHALTMPASDIVAAVCQRIPALVGNERVAQVAQEVSRAAGGELHNISALTGGMVAQEVIKIITKQYVPIDNTCIFDGIESRCQVLQL